VALAVEEGVLLVLLDLMEETVEMEVVLVAQEVVVEVGHLQLEEVAMAARVVMEQYISFLTFNEAVNGYKYISRAATKDRMVSRPSCC
jgi:hypothetical protein